MSASVSVVFKLSVNILGFWEKKSRCLHRMRALANVVFEVSVVSWASEKKCCLQQNTCFSECGGQSASDTLDLNIIICHLITNSLLFPLHFLQNLRA